MRRPFARFLAAINVQIPRNTETLRADAGGSDACQGLGAVAGPLVNGIARHESFSRVRPGLAHDRGNSAAYLLRNYHESKNPRDHYAAGLYNQARGPQWYHAPLKFMGSLAKVRPSIWRSPFLRKSQVRSVGVRRTGEGTPGKSNPRWHGASVSGDRSLSCRRPGPPRTWRAAASRSRPSLGPSVAAGRASPRTPRCRAGSLPW